MDEFASLIEICKQIDLKPIQDQTIDKFDKNNADEFTSLTEMFESIFTSLSEIDSKNIQDKEFMSLVEMLESIFASLTEILEQIDSRNIQNQKIDKIDEFNNPTSTELVVNKSQEISKTTAVSLFLNLPREIRDI